MARIRQIAIVVFAGVASMLPTTCAGGTDAPPTRTPSTQAADPTPEATDPPEEATTTVPLGGFPAGNALEPGRYASHPGFDLPFAIELGPGWRSIRDDALGVVSFVVGRTNGIGQATQWLSFFPAPPDVGTYEPERPLRRLRRASGGGPATLTFADAGS